MLAPNIQHSRKLDSHTQKHLVGYPNLPFGFTIWTPFTRCNKKRIVEKSIQFGHVPESTQHLEVGRLDNRTARQSPVEEPPNQPKKPPVKEPGNLPERPPLPNEPPVEEPPNEPGRPPVKEPLPKDPDRQPPQNPPIRAVLDMVKDEGRYWSAEVGMGNAES